MAMLFRPCIDLHAGKVKQIVGATLKDATAATSASAEENFVSELPAAHFAARYRDDGLRGGHVIMLGPGNEEAALSALRAYPNGMHVGGGITPANAMKFIDAGASHVIVTSYVFRNGAIDWERLDELVACVGKDRLVLDLSCRRKRDAGAGAGGEYFVVTDRWQTYTDVAVNRATLQKLAAYCAEFLVHGVDVEGTRTGIDDALVRMLGACSPIPVTYAGGARDLSDMARVRVLGRGRVGLTIGSALDLFGGECAYADVVAWDRSVASQRALRRGLAIGTGALVFAAGCWALWRKRQRDARTETVGN